MCVHIIHQIRPPVASLELLQTAEQLRKLRAEHDRCCGLARSRETMTSCEMLTQTGGPAHL